MPEMSVEPYREVTFDEDGDVNAAQRDSLAEMDVTDLVMFAHGWNNSPSIANQLYSAFFAPFPGLTGEGVRLGYVGVVWPSMKFTDEPIPDFRPSATAPPLDSALDKATQDALVELFPGHDGTDVPAVLDDDCICRRPVGVQRHHIHAGAGRTASREAKPRARPVFLRREPRHRRRDDIGAPRLLA